MRTINKMRRVENAPNLLYIYIYTLYNKKAEKLKPALFGQIIKDEEGYCKDGLKQKDMDIVLNFDYFEQNISGITRDAF